jgi:tetratricopeptide (TPR) repeat protein
VKARREAVCSGAVLPRCSLPVVFAALVVANVARAEARDPAAADALFRDARAAMQRGDYPTACAKLEESQRLDPAPGTLLNLAECEEKRGRLATAWEDYQGALDTLGSNDERVALATQRAAALFPRLPKLVVRVAPGAPAAARVKRDGVELGAASLGTELPVNPGRHEIVVVAPGRRARSYGVDATEGRAASITVDVGEPDPAAAVPAEPGAGGRPRGNPTLGYVALGVGGAALLAGGVTGVLALGRARVADEHCDAAHTCDPTGLDANRDGKTFSTLSTVLFATSALLVAGGLVWIFTR